MRGNAALAEPALAPKREAKRRELTEMRRALDRAAAEAELLCGGIVVNGCVLIILLLGEHLQRRAPGTSERVSGSFDWRCKWPVLHAFLRVQTTGTATKFVPDQQAESSHLRRNVSASNGFCRLTQINDGERHAT